MAYFSTPVAIFLTLSAAAMWGSWMQIVKIRKGYPIIGVAVMLYIFSFILVWGITLILSPILLPDGIAVSICKYQNYSGEIILGGAMMSLGMIISLTIMNNLGLMLATTLSGAITSILGIITSIYKEGLPDNPFALPLIVLTAAIFIIASCICSKASAMCAQDRSEDNKITRKDNEGKLTFKDIALIVFDSILMNGWASGTATGTAAGIPPILTCAFMATGSALSITIIGAVVFTKKRMWKTVLCIGSSKRPLVLSAISACCHYGGNMLSIYSMPAISATLSFLFGKTSNIWTYFWGLYYKEFSGAKKKTLVTLGIGLLMYFTGLGLLFVYNFGS